MTKIHPRQTQKIRLADGMMILRAPPLHQPMSLKLLRNLSQKRTLSRDPHQQVRKEESSNIRLLKRRRRLSLRLLVRKILNSLRDTRLRSTISILLHKMLASLHSMSALSEVLKSFRRE